MVTNAGFRRIEPLRLTTVGQGLFESSQIEQSAPAHMQRRDVVWPNFVTQIEPRMRVLQSSQFVQGNSAFARYIPLAWPELEGMLKAHDSVSRASQVDEDLSAVCP